MNDAAERHLAGLLARYRPRTLLVVSFSEPQSVDAYIEDNPATRVTRLTGIRRLEARRHLARYELAVVADQLEHVGKAAGVSLLGALRNLYSNRLAVCLDPARVAASERWSRRDFLGLGLLPAFAPADEGAWLYVYDIERYNFEREWNNPRDWANPENFDKYRW